MAAGHSVPLRGAGGIAGWGRATVASLCRSLFLAVLFRSSFLRARSLCSGVGPVWAVSLGVFHGASEGSGGSHSCKCAQLEELFKQVATLREEPNRQRRIRECEREIDMWYCALSQAEPLPRLKAAQGEG